MHIHTNRCVFAKNITTGNTCATTCMTRVYIVYVCMYIYMHIYMCVYIFICIHMFCYMLTYLLICIIQIYIHIYTYHLVLFFSLSLSRARSLYVPPSRSITPFLPLSLCPTLFLFLPPSLSLPLLSPSFSFLRSLSRRHTFSFSRSLPLSLSHARSLAHTHCVYAFFRQWTRKRKSPIAFLTCVERYGVATISSLLKITGLFGEYRSLL